MMKVAPTVGMKPETKSWGSAAEMADEVSQRENDFLGGTVTCPFPLHYIPSPLHIASF